MLIGFRYSLKWDLHDCVVEEDKSYVCQGQASINGFIYCGVAMTVMLFFLAIISRLYELKLMETRGITS